MENKICFVANFSKTYLFDKIASLLKLKGFDIYWIVVNEKLYKYLLERYDKEKILYISKKNVKIDSEYIGDFKINEIIYGDRVWKYSIEDGIKFLKNIQKPIYDFINKNSISLLIGEKTWAHELLISRIVKNKFVNVKFYNIITARLPDDRLFFVDNEKEEDIIELKSIENISIDNITVKSPDYKIFNDKIVKKNFSLIGRINRLKRFITSENIENNDPCLISNLFLRIRLVITEEVNKEMYRYFIKKHNFAEYSNKKYIFFGFHKQPEASVDVCGRYYEDQLQNVKNLWRLLPNDWYLIIKEHSNAIGDRGYRFYKKIKSLPNVILVNENTNVHEIIKNSQLVVSNTGTMALEAALMNIPSVVLSKTFFTKLDYCNQLTFNELSKIDLEAYVNDVKSKDNNIEEYSKYVFQNSFEAKIYDPITFPSVLDKNNLNKLAIKISEILIHV